MIGAFSLKLKDSIIAKFYPFGENNYIDWASANEVNGFTFYNYIKEKQKKSHEIIIDNPVDRSFCIRLRETVKYCCKIENKGNVKEKLSDYLPRFKNEDNKFLKVERDSDFVSFVFINYLGLSSIIFDSLSKSIPIEIIPNKIDYEEDYIKLTEAIADECSKLLLECSGVTYSRYTHGENDANLLEQFIFLRQFCYSENLESLFESIKLNPDRRLKKEEVLKPFGSGLPSQKFFSNPFSYSRSWCEYEGEYYPEEISVTRKYDYLDTPANRFIKFALSYFKETCEKLITYLEKNKIQAECLKEAKFIHNILEDILYDPFFDDISELEIMPQNNQILQKREGYSQIFNAFSMINLSLQLDWKGKDDVYEGESKNTALLYEYWLFFVLYSIIKNIAEPVPSRNTTIKEAIKYTEDEINVSLKQGQPSIQSFYIKDSNININLYYNRGFGPKDFKGTVYWGSYSRSFRPDYTIAIFKGKNRSEKDAVEEGNVSYIHFDAKYRLTDLRSFISNTDKTSTASEAYDSTLSDSELKQLEEEKRDSITNTYKNGDLLKMHTYNDAIRRTLGSYVLYPGNNKLKDKTRFKLYEEILPGVGAFAVKPSILKESKNELKSFIEDMINHYNTSETRWARKSVLENIIISEPSIEKNSIQVINGNLNKSDNLCLIGYMRPDYLESIKDNLKIGGKFLFFYYAINKGYVYTHHKDSMKAQIFRFYSNIIKDSGAGQDVYELSKFHCKINSTELVSKATLEQKLMDGKSHNADFYYLCEIEVVSETKEKNLTIHQINEYPGNDILSPHSVKVVTLDMTL